MFGCKVARRGFWGSSGSLHNSSSTFHHLGSYGFPSRTHLCLVMIGRETERKVSEKSNSWITIQSILKQNCVSTVKVQVILLQQHLFWQWRHRRRNPQIRKGGKPLVQPHRTLTKALSVQYHENRAIKCAPNRRAISGTATWIHHQNVPLTQQAGFMAPSIKLAPD